MGGSDVGMLITIWLVRVSVAFYAIAVYRVVDLPPREQRTDSVKKWCWMLSWAFCVAHVIAAFHFIHKWSHDAALKHTAEMTERVVGVHWSGGLFINYMFLAWWGVDAVRQLAGQRTSLSLHLVAAFMMFNATVVFGPKWWGVPAAILVGLLLMAFRNRPAGISPPPGEPSHQSGDG